MELDTITAQDAHNRLVTILHDLELEPDAQGVTPLEAVAILALVERDISAVVTSAMRTAKQTGHTLEEIGHAVGTSRQAVWNRLSRTT